MPAGDALDQVLSELDAQQQQQRAARRVPAPAPRTVAPVTASSPAGGGRAASSVPPRGGPSLWDRAKDVATSALETLVPGTAANTAVRGAVTGIGAGVLRSPVTAAAGISDFAGDVSSAVAGPKADFRNYEGKLSSAGVQFRYNPSNAETISGFSKRIDPVASIGNPTANEAASQMASLAIGYGAGAKLAGLAKLPGAAEIASGLTNPVARGAATLGLRAAGLSAVDAVVMDPEVERFSNLLQTAGVHTEFTDWLAHTDQESHMAGRFKNAVEGLGLGAATDGLLNAGRYWHARLTGDHATADAIQQQLAAVHDGEQPDYIVEPQQPSAPAAKPEAPGYVGGWEDAPDGSVRPVYEKDPVETAAPDVKAQADDSGVVPSEDGKTAALPSDQGPSLSSAPPPKGGEPVTPEAVSGGEPGTAADHILSFRVKRTPDDPGVEVGPIDRRAIQGLANDVRSWREATNIPETRGQGVQYHGARGEVPNLSEGYYNPENIYGGFDTFYTTDAQSIAAGYGRKRAGAKVYQVDEKAPVKSFDMEQPLTPERVDELFAGDDLAGMAVENLQAEHEPVSLRNVMDEMRLSSGGEGISKDEVQERFDTAIHNLQKEDYGAMTHTGGLKTGKEPHNVKIYFNAPQQVSLKEVPPPSRAVLDVKHPSDTAAEHGEFRLGNIGSQESVAPLLRAVIDHLPEQAPRSDAELMADAGRAASEIGEDPASLLEAARLISGKLSDADIAMVTLRTVWKRAEQDLDALPNTDWESAPQDEVDRAAQRVYNMMAISSHVQEAKAGLGRGLRVNQLPDADTYLNTVQKSGVAPEGTFGPSGPLPRTRQEIKDWFELWGSTKGEPDLRAALLEGALTRIVPSAGHYLRSSFANFFTASILSAPRTLLLNLIGPAAMSVIRNVERLSGSALASVNPMLDAGERAAARATARATVPAYLQTFGDIADTMRWAWKAAEQNKSVIGGGGTIDSQAAFGPWTPSLIEAARPGTGPLASTAYSLGNAINMWPQAVQRINGGFDEFSKRLAYLGEVRVRALQEGISQGLTGNDLTALVKQRLQGSFNEVGHATDDDVLREAERTTLTYKTGEEGGLLRQGYTYINKIRREIPETRYILPVLGVPANTLGEALRRLPIAAMPGINNILFKRTADELAGAFGPVIQADAHGRMITGATFLMGGIMLNRMGLLTGAGPQNPTDRKVWLMEHQPYSLRVGDSWVRYDKYDVLGGLLSIPSTITDATTNIREDKGYGDMILSGVGALAQWFKDRAALRGATGLFALGDDPTANASSVASQTGGSLLQGMIPNAIQAPITQAIDPYQRMRRNWSDYLEAAIPGLSSQLPPVRNVLGEPVQRPANSVGEGVFPVTIAPAVTYKTDPVIDELDRIYQATGYGAGADPKALGYGQFNPRDLTLENGQNMFDAAMQARQVMPLHGRTLRQSLGKLFASPEYNKAVDADPGQKVTSRGDASRGYMVEQVFNAYNKAIKAELAEASPTANKWLTAAAAKQRDDAYLKDVNVQDLANNPDLYHTHGINGAVYSAKVRAGATGALVNALRSR